MGQADDRSELDSGESRGSALYRSLEQFFTATGDAVVLLDLDMKIARANQALSNLVGLSVEELQARSMNDILDENDLFAMAGFETAFCDGVIANLNTGLQSKEGECIPVTANGMCVRDEGDCLVGYAVTFHDIREVQHQFSLESRLVAEERAMLVERNEKLAELYTELKIEVKNRKVAQFEAEQAREKAEEANRLKTEFLANMSHELRTPLNAIINVPRGVLEGCEEMTVWDCKDCKLDFVEDGPGDAGPQLCPECAKPMNDATHLAYMGEKEEVERLLNRVESSGQELLDLIANLLDTVKLEAGKVSLKLSVVSLNEVVANVEAMLSSLAEEKEIELSHSISKSGFTIAADPVRLQQILFNLVGNALKFTNEGGTVSVSVKPRELKGAEGVEFAVRDNGIGRSLEDCGIIFESFRQVDGSHTREHKGSGLGLPIVRSLVELHGGVIFVESRRGVGSCFTFVLPIDGPEF